MVSVRWRGARLAAVNQRRTVWSQVVAGNRPVARSGHAEARAVRGRRGLRDGWVAGADVGAVDGDVPAGDVALVA